MNEYERLVKIADRYFKNLSILADLLGKDKRTFYSYKGRSGVGTKILEELKEKLNINPEYIKYGREPMLLTGKGQNVAETVPDNVYRVPQQELERLAQIKLYSVPAHAYEAKTLHSFDDIPVSSIPLSVGIQLDPKIHDAVVVYGVSMKDAGISSGDVIIYDNSKKELIENKLYLLSLNGALMVKRVSVKDGTIHLESANNGVEPFIVNHVDDKLTIFGQLKMILKYLY